jgi:hypothetical protein
MTHPPPSPPRQRPHLGLHPILKRLLRIALILVAIPAIAYGLFLAFVLGYAALHGPIRWN